MAIQDGVSNLDESELNKFVSMDSSLNVTIRACVLDIDAGALNASPFRAGEGNVGGFGTPSVASGIYTVPLLTSFTNYPAVIFGISNSDTSTPLGYHCEQISDDDKNQVKFQIVDNDGNKVSTATVHVSILAIGKVA